jgi:NAD(P)-dependent dehydrogenase (short-subunit alcohol dehydrogenase family)
MNETLTGKTVVVTGASSGVGAAAARQLAALGATVAVVGRDHGRTMDVAEQCSGRGRAFVADLSSLASVAELASRLAETYPVIDVLANNAGFIAASKELTVDGIETTFAVNHVAPFLLTQLLDANLRASTDARVITTSSTVHSSGKLDRPFDRDAKWTSWGAYGDSKLANIAFTAELARRMQGSKVIASCFHPGVVHTGFGRDKGLIAAFQKALGPIFLLTPEKGADTLVFLASDSGAASNNGKYWVKRRVVATAMTEDRAAAETLWTRTAALVDRSTS